jgi:translation initiation factor 2B subunit (eIF-2B alpha/beta/delta family)
MVVLLAQTPELVSWLIQQAPVVVVMGAAIYWLAKKLNKAESDKDDMAKEVIKLTTLWEEKSDKIEEKTEKTDEKNAKVTEQILELLREIKLNVTK